MKVYASKMKFSKMQVAIYGSNQKLLSTWMIDGKIDAAIPDEIVNLPNWKAPLRIAVHKGNNIGSKTG